ncbi:MAG: protein kinase [Umezawaea sp.]
MNAVDGRYVLKEQLGSGGMGVVWLAHDELLHREVAVKQLKLPNVTPGASDVARAMREARIAARLQHPNAITVFDVVVEDDLPWIVMEYLPSRSLAALLSERGPLSPGETARIGEKIATALAAAHAAGIVHRDVKPGNVLIGHNGAVKLTDFGISRAVGDVTLTEAGSLSGTPAYLAPEIARGEAPDARSDVFSLGATLFAALEGHSPYGDTDNHLGLLHRAANGKVERSNRAGGLLRPLERLLAIDPAQRPTASQAAEMLGVQPPEVLNTPRGIPVQAPPTTPRPMQLVGPPTPRPLPRVGPPTPQRSAAQAVPPTPQRSAAQAVPTAPPHSAAPAGPSTPPPAAPAAKTRSRKLLSAAVAVLLVAVLSTGLVLLRQAGMFGDTAQSSTGSTGPTGPAEDASLLTPTSACNFVIGWFRLTKNEPQTAWDRMDPATRPPFEKFTRYAGNHDEIIPDTNPDVAAKEGGYLVTGQVTFKSNGQMTGVEHYEVLVSLVDGELKLTEHNG